MTLTRSELIQQAALAVLMAPTSQSSGMDGLPGGGRVFDARGQMTETGCCYFLAAKRSLL